MIYYILKKCPYSEFFWSVFSHFWSIFSCIPSEYEDLQNKLVQMRENRDQKNSDTNTNTFHTVIFSQNFHCNNKMKCSYYKIKYLHTKCSNFDTCNLGITNILNLAIIVEHLRLFWTFWLLIIVMILVLEKNIEDAMLPITKNWSFLWSEVLPLLCNISCW